MSIIDPSESEIYEAYDEDAQDHDWSVTFTAEGAPEGGTYRWYYGASLRQVGGHEHTSTLSGPFMRRVRVTYTIGNDVGEDQCIMWYVQAKLQVESLANDQEHAPGAFIGLDDNDSDSNGVIDREEQVDYGETVPVPFVMDFRALPYKLDVGGHTWAHDGNFTLRYLSGDDNITRAFEPGDMQFTRIDVTGDAYQKPASTTWREVYLEGVG